MTQQPESAAAKAAEVAEEIKEQHPETPVPETPPGNPPSTSPAEKPAEKGPDFDFQGLMDSLDALPEKVANAVREAMPQPPPAKKTAAAPAKKAAAAPSEKPEPVEEPIKPGKKSFAEMWFGR